jgi:hypothetical protein
MITRQIEGGVEEKHTKDDNGILRQDKKKRKKTEKNLRKNKIVFQKLACGRAPAQRLIFDSII